MPERIVMLGDGLLYADAMPEKEREQFANWMTYKDTWIAEECEALGIEDTDDYRDDLFRNLDDFLEFWGTEYTDEAVGSISARRYKNFTEEDEKFYQQLVENADEPKHKSQIRFLKPQSMEARAIKISMKRQWQEIAKGMS